MSVTTTTTPAQTGEEPGNSNGGVTGGTPAAQQQAGNDQQDRTFSQQAVNALIGARLKEAKAQWEKDAKDAAERDEAEKNGEYQKLADKERARADKAEQERDATIQSARASVLRSEIRSVAVELGFANPAVAYRLVDTAQVDYDDATGEPRNVKKLLEQLAKDEPYLIAGGQQGGNAAIPRTPNGSTMTQDQRIQAEIEVRRKSGRYVA